MDFNEILWAKFRIRNEKCSKVQLRIVVEKVLAYYTCEFEAINLEILFITILLKNGVLGNHTHRHFIEEARESAL